MEGSLVEHYRMSTAQGDQYLTLDTFGLNEEYTEGHVWGNALRIS
jgi:hypothetical protein